MRYALWVVLFFVIPLQANVLQQVSLQLKWKDQFQFAGYYVAKEKGFYRDAGFDVTIKPFKPHLDSIGDVVTGKTTFAIGNSSLIARVSNHGDIKLLAAIYQSSPLALLAVDPNIKRIEDFKNRSIAIEEVDGGSVALLSMLMSQGVNIDNLKLMQPTFSVQDIIDKKVDVITAYISNEPFQLKQRGISYRLFDPAQYGFDFYEDILFTSMSTYQQDPDGVQRFKKASLRGWRYAFEHIDEVIDLIDRQYNTQRRSKAALRYEAKTLKTYAKNELGNLGAIDTEKLGYIRDIFSLMGFIHTTRDLKPYVLRQTPLHLSQREKNYLAHKDAITICANPDMLPLQAIKNGELYGIAAEFVHQIEQKIDTPLRLQPTTTWQECIELIKRGQCDMATLIAVNPNKHQNYLVPSHPYISGYLAFVTKIHQPYVNNLDDLTHQRVAILKETHNLQEYIRRFHPHLKLITVSTSDEGLRRVANGSLYAYIGPQYTLAHSIREEYSDELKIMGKIGQFKLQGAFGIRKDLPELLGIINKSIASIDPAKSQHIYNSWVPVIYDKGFDYGLLWKISAAVLAFFAFLLSVGFKLRRKNHQLERYKKELETLNHSLNQRIEDAVSELKEQKVAFETLYRKSADGVLLMHQGRFTDCNESVIQMLDVVTKDDVIGKRFSDFAPTYQPDGKKSDETSDQMIGLCCENGINRFEWMLRKSDDTTFMVEIVLTRFTIAHQEIIHVVWRDIEERLRIEQQNKEQEQLLYHQAKNAQLGEMIGMIAHQWRQPLNALSATLLGLRIKEDKGTLTSEKLKKSLDTSAELIHRMSETIYDFMNFLQSDMRIQSFAINDMLKDIDTIVGPQLESIGIVLRYRVDKTLHITSYRNELAHVLINLITNAFEAYRTHKKDDMTISVTIEAINDDVLFRIEDQAGGIPDSIITKIFDPYFSTKKSQGGSGIGLYMSKRIVEGLLHGTIDVQNENNGAVFIIRLKQLA